MNRIDNKLPETTYIPKNNRVDTSINKFNSVTNEDINELNNKVLTIGDIENIEDTKKEDNYYQAINQAFKINNQQQLWGVFLGTQLYHQVALLEQKNKAKNMVELIEEHSEEEDMLTKMASQIAYNECDKNEVYDIDAELIWLEMFKKNIQFKEQLEKHKYNKKVTSENIIHSYCITVPIKNLIEVQENDFTILMAKILEIFNGIHLDKYISILNHTLISSIITFDTNFNFKFNCNTHLKEQELMIQFKEHLFKLWKNIIIIRIEKIGFELSEELTINKLQ